MKYVFCFLALSLSFLFSCSQGEQKQKKVGSLNQKVNTQFDCKENYDSMLMVISKEFEPTSIELNKSLSSNANSFLLNVDTNCLRRQSEYVVFITIILSKLYLHHLKCCNQGYDLLSMKDGAGGVIINEFENLVGYDKNANLEFLNSFKIVDYIKSRPDLLKNPELRSLLKKIDKEEKRIEKGVM